MKKDSIALIQLTDKHTEVLGGLITLFKEFYNNIYIYYYPYTSDFIKYYRNIFKNKVNIILCDISKDIKIHEHDMYIFTTALEYLDFNNELHKIPKNKLLLLSHNSDEYKEIKTCQRQNKKRLDKEPI